MTVGERIRMLRKELGQTQSEFGERVGLKQSSLGQIESGTRNATDRSILLICEKYGVNEEWLRTGQGDMFQATDDSLLSQLKSQYDLDEFGVRFLETFLNLSQEQRTVIKQLAQSLLSADSAPPTPAPHTLTVAELEEEYKKRRSSSASATTSTASSTTSATDSKAAGD